MKNKFKLINIIIICLILILFVFNFYFKKQNNKFLNENQYQEEKIEQKQEDILKEEITTKNTENNENTAMENNVENWYLEIPKINLLAPIGEGTEKDILNTKIGHFKETAIEAGNIGLAAHNRGYKFNYFANLKKLKENDEIIYKHENFKKTYIVEKNIIIKNYDWTNLENTDENKITLITCVENEPEYRRCVQAIAIEDKGI